MEYGHIWTSQSAPTTYSGVHANKGSFTLIDGTLVMLRGGLYNFTSHTASPSICAVMLNGVEVMTNVEQTDGGFVISVPEGSHLNLVWTPVDASGDYPPVITQIRQLA